MKSTRVILILLLACISKITYSQKYFIDGGVGFLVLDKKGVSATVADLGNPNRKFGSSQSGSVQSLDITLNRSLF
jgi:hypothetical protein